MTILTLTLLATLAGGLTINVEADDMIDSTTKDAIVLEDFGAPPGRDWVVINDGVMGGVSQSAMLRSEQGTGVFTGLLSLENNGGFVSTRVAVVDHDLSDFTGLEIRVRGDGRTYQLRVRTDDLFDGVSYRARFETRAGEWTTVRLPFRSFLPTYRGRVLNDIPPLDPSGVRQVGLLLADKIPGRFSLEIDFIRTFDAKDSGS